MSLKPEIVEKIKQLEAKYETMGQDLESYLEGLLHSDYLKYWDYIQLDTLLNLQKTKTSFPDENVFIIYHQITELYFKLILLSSRQIAEKDELNADFFCTHLTRINTYFEMLIRSFDIMIKGMEKDQFLKFRMALLPASGFQSAQYRLIEMSMTDLKNLVDHEEKDSLSKKPSLKDLYEHLYWKKGATELATGKKTLTLKQFEEKYEKEFLEHAQEFQHQNLWQRFQQLPKKQKNEELKEKLRQTDFHANVNWPLVHYKAAVRYLYQKPADLAATGGTNWQKYLPPRNQKIIFFPGLWSKKDKSKWGEELKEKYTFLAEDRQST